MVPIVFSGGGCPGGVRCARDQVERDTQGPSREGTGRGQALWRALGSIRPAE